MKRRSFFGAIGAAAVGGRSMAKQAVSATTEALAGTGVKVAGMDLRGTVPMGSMAMAADNASWHGGRLALINLAKAIGIPAFKHREMREQAKYDPIDLDIASFVSVSPVMKAQMQRERSYHRQIETWGDWYRDRIERAMWAQANGGDLP